VLTIGAAGVLAGGLHVLSGPDHLAALAPLAADSRGAGWKAGVSWGLGHTSGVVLVGLLALLLRELLPVDAVSSWSERLVGVALIAVGLWGARQASRLQVHRHEHRHDGASHAHVHVHVAGEAAAGGSPHARAPHVHTHASVAFGVLHGLAGSSHVLGILPALALPSRAQSVLYLFAYGVGTIAAMALFSWTMHAVGARARDGGVHVYRGLLYACSALALLVGGVWLSA
jgi:sulfite exporter TauE/SafE